MAVHLPLSVEAQIEARVLMMSTNNILSPASGKPIITPTQDIVLGAYYLTRERQFAQGEGMKFASIDDLRAGYDAGVVDLQASVEARIEGKLQKTTVGRALFFDIVPEGVPFELVNRVMDRKTLGDLVNEVYRRVGNKATVILSDRLRTLGYEFATARASRSASTT
jgi:DNA-directed RNA polymerase subunit beta'